jgi:Ni/Co efflux regulator RcnB
MKRLLLLFLALILVAAPAADAAKGKGKSGKAAAAKTCSAAKSAKKKSKKAKAAAKKGKKAKSSTKTCGKKTKKAAKKTGAGAPDAVAAANECRADKAEDPEGFAVDFGAGADAVAVCVEELLAIQAGDDDAADVDVEDGDVVDESLPPADEPVDEGGFIEEGEGEDVPLI